MDTYLAVDQTTNIIVSILDWDGISPFVPPVNTVLIKFNEIAGEGWQWDGVKAIDPRTTETQSLQVQSAQVPQPSITDQLASELGVTADQLTIALKKIVAVPTV